MFRLVVPVVLSLACPGPADADPVRPDLGQGISPQGLGAPPPGDGPAGGAGRDPGQSRGFAYRFPAIRDTGPAWLEMQGDGSLCVDVDRAGRNCDLRLREDTLLLLSVDQGRRFRFRLELGVRR